jgi:hypothetical protein
MTILQIGHVFRCFDLTEISIVANGTLVLPLVSSGDLASILKARFLLV